MLMGIIMICTLVKLSRFCKNKKLNKAFDQTCWTLEAIQKQLNKGIEQDNQIYGADLWL